MEEVKANLSDTVKRRLRRIRRAQLPTEERVSEPLGPGLSKTQKRKLRCERKMAQLTEKQGDMKTFISNQNGNQHMWFGEDEVPEEKKTNKVASRLQSGPVKEQVVDKEVVDNTFVSGLASDDSSAVIERSTEKSKVKSIGKVTTKKTSRYVLFVGNLPYELTNEALAAHFSKTGLPPRDVRLSMQDNNTTVNKGFAHVEFNTEEGYLNGLKLHHSFLDGRRINVEYTTIIKGKKAKSKNFVKKKDLKLKALYSKKKKINS
ncbi:uncharacterized protein LOC134527156 [Bacillus rossius redtenbacheri]|uniref:uncharacterized protein LOC134527156 n=1 Tax=Bacillus rossius redtenbacheri TaxID=93214 RepID=UPI002FDE3B89